MADDQKDIPEGAPTIGGPGHLVTIKTTALPGSVVTDVVQATQIPSFKFTRYRSEAADVLYSRHGAPAIIQDVDEAEVTEALLETSDPAPFQRMGTKTEIRRWDTYGQQFRDEDSAFFGRDMRLSPSGDISGEALAQGIYFEEQGKSLKVREFGPLPTTQYVGALRWIRNDPPSFWRRLFNMEFCVPRWRYAYLDPIDVGSLPLNTGDGRLVKSASVYAREKQGDLQKSKSLLKNVDGLATLKSLRSVTFR
eukprot:GHVT01100390.1.p1 GENE.GHVT01100390.1~~GHVT01100390.1.p1  ORF type:complete len:287 (+),score=24.40 GHVT01100390.1:110-862(+)